MAVSESNPATVVKWEDAGRAPSKTKRPVSQQYQDLKFTLHRKLLDKINLEALASIETQQLRNEVRSALTALMDEEQTLLSALERNQLISEVLDEVFGLGPLEPLLQDPTVSGTLAIDNGRLRHFAAPHAIENLNGAVAHHTRNVKRWRDGRMVLRWVGAALVQAGGGFRRVRGMRDLPKLCAVLDRHRSARTLNSERKVA